MGAGQALCGAGSTQTTAQSPFSSKYFPSIFPSISKYFLFQVSAKSTNITSATSQDSLGGLEAKSVSGDWLAADPIPGAILINVGDLLENLSSGR